MQNARDRRRQAQVTDLVWSEASVPGGNMHVCKLSDLRTQSSQPLINKVLSMSSAAEEAAGMSAFQ